MKSRKLTRRKPVSSLNIGALFRQRRQEDHDWFVAMVARNRPEPAPEGQDRATELKQQIAGLQAELAKLEGGN